jgi:segregation and condensation protein A
MVVLSRSKGELDIAIEASHSPAAGGAATASASTGPNSLLVKLDVFDGPLDLLLQLVLAQDLDITKVSLASVCEQYLSYIGVMESLDIEVASEYLVIAATLTFIKSKRLLPPPPPPFVDELAEEAAAAEEALRQRLLAYQHFKILGADLRERFELNRSYHPRTTVDEEGLVQRYQIRPEMLATAFMQALNAAQARPMVVKRETFSVVVKMNYLLRQVKQDETVSLFSLVAGSQALEIVVTFLAALELVRAHKITCEQRAPFGDIVLRLAPKESSVRLLESA